MEESQEADVRCVWLVASRIGEGLQLEERGSVNVCGDGGFRGGAKSLWRSGGVLDWWHPTPASWLARHSHRHPSHAPVHPVPGFVVLMRLKLEKASIMMDRYGDILLVTSSYQWRTG